MLARIAPIFGTFYAVSICYACSQPHAQTRLLNDAATDAVAIENRVRAYQIIFNIYEFNKTQSIIKFLIKIKT